MSLSKHFKTVKDLEKLGVACEYGLNSKGKPITFMIARAGGSNQAYLDYLEALSKPHRHAIQTERVDNKVLQAILKKAFISKCLKGWENVEAEWLPTIPMEVTIDGITETKDVHPDLPFTQENVEKLYEEFPDLYTDHQDLASKNAMYLQEVRKADAKN